MRLILIAAALALGLPSAAAVAQTNPPSPLANPPSPAAKTPASSAGGGITREQYIERARERAAKHAANRFDQLDANHDGVVDRAELRAWRSQHTRAAKASTGQVTPQ